MVRPCRKLQLGHGGFQQGFASIVQQAVCAQVCWVHVRVAGQLGAGKTCPLQLTGSFDIGADYRGWFTQPGIA